MQEFNINWADDKHGMTYLMVASDYGHAHIVAYMLENGGSFDMVDVDGITALWIAATRNHVESVRLLLEKGADPNCQPSNKQKHAFPLYIAAQENHVEVCELLLRYNADVDQKCNGVTSLEVATHKKNTNIVKMLQTAIERKNEIRRKEIIANIAKAEIEQEKKEEKLREDTKIWENLVALI